MVAGDERDEIWFSHRLVKVIRPEMLYDSCAWRRRHRHRKAREKGNGVDRAEPLAGVLRDDFARFFGSRSDENESRAANQGIPQRLRLMNGPLLNDVEKDGGRISTKGVDATDAVSLAAYSRRPTDEERRVVRNSNRRRGASHRASSALRVMRSDPRELGFAR